MTDEEIQKIALAVLREQAKVLQPVRLCNHYTCDNFASHLVPGGDGNGSPLCDAHFQEYLSLCISRS